MSLQIYTIGHSTQSAEAFIHLLQGQAVTLVADVRSVPHSRRNPQFNRQTLTASLEQVGIQYAFLGKELGARSEDPACYVEDRVQYALLAQTALFHEGITRVLALAAVHRVALMCAEKEPLECHRTLLVARALEKQEVSIQHILIDGQVESHRQAIARLIRQLRLPAADLFQDEQAQIEEAYERQGRRIAYQRPH